MSSAFAAPARSQLPLYRFWNGGGSMDPATFNNELDEMAANGAQGSDREWTDILEYLVKHYSPVAVNKATATELAATLDVPAAVAEAIVRARTEKGRLASIDDLKQAAGVEAAPKIDARKDRLVF